MGLETREEVKRLNMQVWQIALEHGENPRGYSLIEVVGMLKQRKHKLTDDEKEIVKRACEVRGLDYNKIRVFKPKKKG